MLTVTQPSADAILRRALSQSVSLKAKATPITVPILIAGVSMLSIIGACFAEFYSAGVGFHAAFPVKSDGKSLANELMTLRYPIIFCLLAGDVILHAISGRAKRLLDAVTNYATFSCVVRPPDRESDDDRTATRLFRPSTGHGAVT